MSPPAPHSKPLRTQFLLTSMPVGGAETLLSEIVKRMDRTRFQPEITCLKQLGALGETISHTVPTTSGYLSHKYDLRVLPRLIRHMRRRQVDAVVTVGAGDKMFWGRLAAYFARVPVIVSALHSTGWPDGIGRLNRLLTPLTDALIAVATEHGRYLHEQERFPTEKIHVIPNGVDTTRFQRDTLGGIAIRAELGIPLDAPVCGIVAALRPEKNHEVFLQVAKRVRETYPDAHFIVVGDGPQRRRLEALSAALQLTKSVSFLGSRSDIPAVLSALNVFALTSKMEANPVSILESLATQVPVVATRVGSVPSTVIDGQTGYLVAPGDVDQFTQQLTKLLADPHRTARLGENGRELVLKHWSVATMVQGYENLITELYQSKSPVSSRNWEEDDTEPEKQGRAELLSV